jgi:hypothetical protein
MAIIVRQHADLVARYPEAAEAGRRLAEADLAAGQLRFIQHLPSHCYSFARWAPRLWKSLREQLGVEPFSHVLNPFPDDDAGLVFVSEHYRFMVEGIEARFRVGIIDELTRAAQQAYAAERFSSQYGGSPAGSEDQKV